jgi:hypothetical protein
LVLAAVAVELMEAIILRHHLGLQIQAAEQVEVGIKLALATLVAQA